MAYKSTRTLSPSEVDELKAAFNVAEDMYIAELKHSGLPVLPFFWSRNDQTGELLIYSAFAQESNILAEKLGIPVDKIKIDVRKVPE